MNNRFCVHAVMKLITHFVLATSIEITKFPTRQNSYVLIVLSAKCVKKRSQISLIRICIIIYLALIFRFEDSITLCNDCIEVKTKREYCPICTKRWDFQVPGVAKEDNEMIECQCKMWIHRLCDPDLSKELFKEFSTTGRVYYCPNCRKSSKNKQLLDIITILTE